MGLLGFLIIFPLAAAAALLLIKNNSVRKVIVCTSGLLIGLGSVVLTVLYLGSGWIDFGGFNSAIIDYLCIGVSVLIGAWIVAYSVKYKNMLALALGLIQVVGTLIFEFGFAHHVSAPSGLYLDDLSLIMALIVGVIGSGICVYGLGYMDDFQEHHKDSPDRRHVFFGLMFIFLSAMFGVIFFNNMAWLFTAWEVTTLCSFLLIGYTKTDEAIKNAFRQIIMNLLGGIAFLAALYFIVIEYHTLSFADFIARGYEYAITEPGLVIFPVTCLAIAGITKAAQIPFHTWLLGAMVAPTPTSALLHSSTMVKAGVFLLVKLAPIFAECVIPGTMVILVGGITFALCSFMAVSQSNAKRVLAYSTIANLGLIVACAGVGTPEAVWAAIFLIVFHAIAKSLLFLCVGTAEHHIGSRDIEDMDLLFERMPRLARYMMLGIMAMFIAPFGMLIAKWGTLFSFVETKQVALILLLAFGSGATFMFWAKWLGKLAGIAGNPDNVEKTVHNTEWAATLLMVILLILACVGLPLISQFLVVPYLQSVPLYAEALASPLMTVPDISNMNLWIASVLAFAVVIILFAGLGKGKAKKVDVYMAGVGVDNENRTYRNSLSQETRATARNWYMDEYFGEQKIAPIGVLVCGLVMIVVLAVSVFYMLGVL